MKHINTAFEVAPDDVETALANIKQPVSEDAAQILFDKYIAPESDRIEKAALWGNDMDQQTDYAHEEIVLILKEAEAIK